MSDFLKTPCTAFAGLRLLASGALIDVALAVKAAEATIEPVLTFDDTTGKVIDLDLRGSTADIVARLTEQGRQATRPRAVSPAEQPDQASPRGRGRPRLGVTAREVTLLPRHWEWLEAQQGGASQALRRLIDNARKTDDGQSQTRPRQEAAYRFMSALAGDLPGFEEAARALFAGNMAGFADRMAGWPTDVREYAWRLAAGA